MKERNVISNLSEIEREAYNLIEEKEEVGIKEIRNTNPRMIGALGKLKSKGLIEFKRVYRQMNQFHKLGRKIVKIKGPKNAPL